MRAFVILLVAAITPAAQAQFVALPDSDTVWITEFDYFGTGSDDAVLYYMEAADHDTLINDTLYSVLMGYTLQSPTLSFAGGIYDNGLGQVYYYHPLSGHHHLIYDFDVEVGDTLAVWTFDFNVPNVLPLTTLEIGMVDTISIAGEPRKVIGIINTQANQGIVHWWIQGIGGTGGLLSSSGAEPLDFSGGLDCMSASDTLWYSVGPVGVPGGCDMLSVETLSAAGELHVSPNPTTGRLKFVFKNPLLAKSNCGVYDAMGRLLYERPLPAGATLQEIDLSRFGKGTYLIKLTDPQGVRYERVVLE